MRNDFDDSLPSPASDALRDWLVLGQMDPAITEWAGSDPARLDWLHELRTVYDAAGRPPLNGNVTQALTRLRSSIDASIDSMPDAATSAGPSITTLRDIARRPRGGFSRIPRVVLGVALAAAAIIAVIVVPRVSQAPVPPRVYATRAGQRATITLEQVRVTLAPMSTIRVNGTTVDLTGQAFFEVSARPRTPFIVRTGSVHTRVLGTSFAVSRYPGDSETQVVVTEGKVSVGAVALAGEPSRSAVVVAAGAWARVGDSVALVQTGAPSDPAEWAHGQLQFHKATVADVLRTVGRWYDLEFRFADSTLANQHVTVTFDETSPTSGFAQLESLLNVNMTIDGKTVTLHRRQTARKAAPRRDTRELFPPASTEVGR